MIETGRGFVGGLQNLYHPSAATINSFEDGAFGTHYPALLRIHKVDACQMVARSRNLSRPCAATIGRFYYGTI